MDFVKEWKSLNSRVEPQLFEDVRAHSEYRAGHAIVCATRWCNTSSSSAAFLTRRAAPDIIPDGWKRKTRV